MKKKYGILALKMSLALFIGWYLLKSGFLTKVSLTTLFTLHHLPWLLLAGIVFLISVILSTWRILLLLRTLPIHLQFLPGFKLTLMGFFFNLVLPGVIGGDVVKGFYLLQYEQAGKGKSSGILVIDRVLGLLAMIGLGWVSILYLLSQKRGGISSYQKELVTLFIIIGLCLVLPIGVLICSQHQRIRKTLRDQTLRIFGQGFFYYLFQSMGILLKQFRILTGGLILSVLIQLLSLAGLLVLSKITAEGSPANMLTLMAVSSLVLLLGIIPVTPGNVGWTELLAAYGWSAIGSNAGAEIFLYWRLVTMLCSLPGGVFYLWMSHHQEQARKTPKASENKASTV